MKDSKHNRQSRSAFSIQIALSQMPWFVTASPEICSFSTRSWILTGRMSATCRHLCLRQRSRKRYRVLATDLRHRKPSVVFARPLIRLKRVGKGQGLETRWQPHAFFTRLRIAGRQLGRFVGPTHRRATLRTAVGSHPAGGARRSACTPAR